MRNPIQGRRKAGFTIAEVLIASTIVTVVGVGISQGLQVAQGSHSTVTKTAGDNRDLRDCFKTIREEIKSSSDSLIVAGLSADGNATVSFQVPVDGAGVASWGAFERRLGSTSAEQNRIDWRITYSVELDAVGTNVLYRRLWDAGGNQQFEEVLASNVRPGDHADGPGFAMDQDGDVWVITLTIVEQEGNGIRSETMHVRTRN